MSIFKRKPPETLEEQRQKEQQRHEMVQWVSKVWCPLHIKYPSPRDQQAANSAAFWLQGSQDLSFLAATGNATLSGWADRWLAMNPHEDPWQWLDGIGGELGQRMTDDPAFRQALERRAKDQ